MKWFYDEPPVPSPRLAACCSVCPIQPSFALTESYDKHRLSLLPSPRLCYFAALPCLSLTLSRRVVRCSPCHMDPLCALCSPLNPRFLPLLCFPCVCRSRGEEEWEEGRRGRSPSSFFLCLSKLRGRGGDLPPVFQFEIVTDSCCWLWFLSFGGLFCGQAAAMSGT